MAYLAWENIYNFDRAGYFGELYSIYDEKIRNWIQKRKEKTVKEVEELNKAYFKSLANTRASATMMVISFAGAFASALFLLFQYFYFVKGYGINPLENYFFDFVLIYVIYLVVATFIPLGMTFIYRRQILSTTLLLLSYIGIFLSLILISYIILVYSGTNLQEYNERSLYTIPFLLICTVVGFVYHYFWLKRELKKGFSTNRTMGNYFTKSSAHNNNSLLIIFTVSMLGGLLSGKFAIVLGILTAVLFSYGFSQLITEVAYLLYLKTQSKEYWEDVPTKKETFRDLFKGFSLKKAKIRIPIEIVSFVIFVQILYKFGYTDQVIRHTRWLLWLIRLFIISIELDILGSFILYVIKKVNTRFKKGKKKQ